MFSAGGYPQLIGNDFVDLKSKSHLCLDVDAWGSGLGSISSAWCRYMGGLLVVARCWCPSGGRVLKWSTVVMPSFV